MVRSEFAVGGSILSHMLVALPKSKGRIINKSCFGEDDVRRREDSKAKGKNDWRHDHSLGKITARDKILPDVKLLTPTSTLLYYFLDSAVVVA